MNMQTLRKIAKSHNLSPAGLDKIELIRGIQHQEGNFDCFAKAWDGYCDQSACRWRDECLPISVRLAAGN